MKNEKENLYCCPKCGSIEIWELTWVRINEISKTKNLTPNMCCDDMEDRFYCDNCEDVINYCNYPYNYREDDYFKSLVEKIEEITGNVLYFIIQTENNILLMKQYLNEYENEVITKEELFNKTDKVTTIKPK